VPQRFNLVQAAVNDNHPAFQVMVASLEFGRPTENRDAFDSRIEIYARKGKNLSDAQAARV
jgi:hypothetical protein